MADGLRARTGGSLPSADVADFLSAEPFALQQHTVAEVTRSLRDAGLPDKEWLQELRGMARDGSLTTFLLKVERHLAAKLRRREQEILAELAIVQQQLCASSILCASHSSSLRSAIVTLRHCASIMQTVTR
jgi:hypothetical protein